MGKFDPSPPQDPLTARHQIFYCNYVSDSYPCAKLFLHLFGVFAARCYASAAYAVMRCLFVCLSVCSYITFIHSVKTNKHIFKLFSPSGSQSILDFPYKTSWRYTDGDRPNKCRWGRHKSQFWTIDDYWSAQSTISGRRCSSVSQLLCASVYGTETDTHQRIRRTEENRTNYLYAALNLKPK